MFAGLVINRSRGCAVLSQRCRKTADTTPKRVARLTGDSPPKQAGRDVLPPKDFGGLKSRSTEHRWPLLAPVLDVLADESGPGMILETTREPQLVPRTSASCLLPPAQPPE
jgi:hypothetical protein